MRFSLVKLQDSGAHGLRGHREPVLALYPRSTAQLGQHNRHKQNTDICHSPFAEIPLPSTSDSEVGPPPQILLSRVMLFGNGRREFSGTTQ
jgi:hypothetical protein